MKRSILSLAVALLFVASACTEEKDIDLVAALNTEYEFEVDGSGTFEESGAISTSELSDIVSDLDADLIAGLKRVSIEAIDVQLTPLSGNSASSVTGSLIMNLNGNDITIFNNESINVDGNVISVTDLNPNGISALADRLESLIEDSDTSEIIGDVSGSVNGGDLSATLIITIRSSVVGTQVVELPNL